MKAITILLFVLAYALSSLSHGNETRPNFLLIIADDVTWSDFGFTGNSDVSTPNLDQLAREGLHFTHMFSSSTTCSPARHALYTGLYPIRSGAYANHSRVYGGTHSLFTYLKDAGYAVGMQGKHHVGPRESFPVQHFDLEFKDDFDATRLFIERAAGPWLLVFASSDPHRPWTRSHGQVPEPDALQLPPYLHDNDYTREQLRAYYGEINKLDWQVGKLRELLQSTDQAENTYIVFVSEQGSTLPYGGKWSLYDNGMRSATIFHHPGKIPANSTDNSLLQYVDIAPTLLELANLDPASIDTGNAGTDNNRQFDGISFASNLNGSKTVSRDYVFAQMTTVGINGFQQPYPMRAVRDHHFKYIRNLASDNQFNISGIHGNPITASWMEDAKSDAALQRRIDFLFKRPAEELYSLEKDPGETRNLAGDARLAEQKAALSQALDQWMAEQGDEGMDTELRAHTRMNQARWNQYIYLAQQAGARGNFTQAIELVETALKKGEDFGPLHPNRALALHNLASFHFSSGNFRAAYEPLEQAITIWSEDTRANVSSIASSYDALATISLRHKKTSLARQYNQRAIDTLTLVLGDEHPQTLAARRLFNQRFGQ